MLLQTQKPGTDGKLPFRGPVDVARHLLREGGIRSLYRGTVATLVRDVPGSVAYFGMYEYLKKKLNKPGELNKGAILFAGGRLRNNTDKTRGVAVASPSPSLLLFTRCHITGMAGVANWSVSIPADVLKSRVCTRRWGRPCI